VVKGSDPSKLKCKLTNSKTLAEEARSIYSSGKEFAYDHMSRHEVHPFVKCTDMRLNIKVDAQRRSVKGILLLFVKPYTAGTRDSEKYIFILTVRPSVRTNPSRKRRFSETLFQKEDFENACFSFSCGQRKHFENTAF